MFADPVAQPDLPLAVRQALRSTPTHLVGADVSLVPLLGTLFHCMVGPPRAYFELPGDAPNAVTRVVYVTLGYHKRVAGMDPDEQDHTELVQRLWEDFKVVYLDFCRRGELQPLLFWRTEPLFRERYDPRGLEVYCRVAIPGMDLTKLLSYYAEGSSSRRL